MIKENIEARDDGMRRAVEAPNTGEGGSGPGMCRTSILPHVIGHLFTRGRLGNTKKTQRLKNIKSLKFLSGP